MIRTPRRGALVGLAACAALVTGAAKAPPAAHAAFEVYRAFPKDAAFNAAHTAHNPTPLVVAVGEKSSFAALLTKFVEGYRAKGITSVKSARIPSASHHVMADNPEAVAERVERYAGDVR
jgi:pimeloyl-ACP methyl ester carboxylesterase